MRLFIYCAGGLGKEICDLARIINEKDNRWREISFIDDVREEREYYGSKVYRFDEVVEKSQNEKLEVTIANGEPYYREKIYEKVKKAELPFTNLIHPDATISPTVKLGEGVIIKINVYVSSDVTIEDNVLLQGSLMIGHDTMIDSHSILSPHNLINGCSKVGKRVYIAPGAVFKDGITIGDDAIIGIGSVVIRNVMQSSIVFGNPARKIGENTEHRVFH